jgi:dTDP-3-amino-2,3,6-trideoxy-4-keto-D-glucose/dTDP-3-amino-3,4,6-trideoxy-alpha-D-glucose/dTDP-2,6-dideoxy-D-kanosamine transaminase
MQSHSGVPFNDLSRTSASVRAEIDASIARVLASGWYVLGPENEAFQSELETYLGVSDVVLLGNGTDALELALVALGVGPGDVVLAVANAGAYGTIATRLLGAHTIYSDVDPETLLATAPLVRAAIEAAPKPPSAIIVTHLYGAMAPIEEIVEVAREFGVPVVEDCAQSIGARTGGAQSGSFGDIATTSFYPTKNLGALGDGGAVFTNRPELAESVRSLRQYGWDSKYHIARDHGRNSRMDELQAAILRAKLPHLDDLNERRRAIHSRYERAASMLNHGSEAFTAHLAVLEVDDRQAFRDELSAAGIGTDVHYPIPDYRQDFVTDRPDPADLPVTARAADRVVSVPMFPELSETEVDRVCDALRGWASNHG